MGRLQQAQGRSWRCEVWAEWIGLVAVLPLELMWGWAEWVCAKEASQWQPSQAQEYHELAKALNDVAKARERRIARWTGEISQHWQVH